MREREDGDHVGDASDIGPTALPGKGQHGPGRPDKRSRLARRAGIGVLLLSVLYGVAWWIAADRVRGIALAWIDARRAAGERIETGDITVSGFPAGIRVSIDEPRWTVDSGTRRTVVSGASLDIFSRIYEPFRLRIESDTPITVRQGPIDGAPNAEARVARWTQAITLPPTRRARATAGHRVRRRPRRQRPQRRAAGHRAGGDHGRQDGAGRPGDRRPG